VVGILQHFRAICCLHFQVRRISQVETWLLIWRRRKGNQVTSKPLEDCCHQRTKGVKEGIRSEMSKYNIRSMNLFQCTKNVMEDN
jgi:hypothetical protein